MIYDITSYNITLMEMYFMMSLTFVLLKLKIIEEYPLIPGIIIITILFIFNDIIFLRKKKYLKIIKMFQNETKKENIISSAIVISIFIFNTFLFIYGIIIMKK